MITLAKDRLEKSEKSLVTMIENMPLGLAITGVDGTIEFSNQAMQNIFAKHELSDEPLSEDGKP